MANVYRFPVRQTRATETLDELRAKLEVSLTKTREVAGESLERLRDSIDNMVSVMDSLDPILINEELRAQKTWLEDISRRLGVIAREAQAGGRVTMIAERGS